LGTIQAQCTIEFFSPFLSHPLKKYRDLPQITETPKVYPSNTRQTVITICPKKWQKMMKGGKVQ